VRDIDSWYYNNYFKAWLRREWMRRKEGLHGGGDGEGSRRWKALEEKIEKRGGNSDGDDDGPVVPPPPPSYQEIVEVFGLQDWNRKVVTKPRMYDPDEARSE